MYVFGYLGPDVKIVLKWVLQQPSQEMDLLNWFSHKLSWVVCKNCVLLPSVCQKRSVQCS